MKPLYFHHPEAEFCHDLETHRANILGTGQTLTLYRAAKMNTTNYFFCAANMEAGESGPGTCGVQCSDYEPRNGKNGRCRFHKHCYEPDLNDTITIADKP